MVTAAEVEAAAELLADISRRTPLVHSRALAEALPGEVWLKCENLQRAGSFKIRGAYTRMARLSAEERRLGVVAASAGNHAQGVALAARLLDLPATVFMPAGAPLPKLAATRGYGAQVHLAGASVDEALVPAKAWAVETGAVLIHPFDHPDIVAGQGTVGAEILAEKPDVRTVVVPAGGGGLLAGIAAYLAARAPQVRVVGVQAEAAAAYPASLRQGCPVPLAGPMPTMADGIAVARPGDVPFGLIAEHVHEMLTVGEEAISRAMLVLLERHKLLVEPAGAVAVAAMLEATVPAGAFAFEPPVVAVLSGGNVDPLLLMRLIRHGMASAGRYLRLTTRLPDAPGSLAGLLATLAAADANVLEVEHVRLGPQIAVNDVEIAVWAETRGPQHCSAVLDAVRAAGFDARTD